MLELAIEEHDDRSGNLQAAFDSAKRLQRIVGDLLDHAALQAGKPRLELSSFCLRELCEEIQRDFQPAAVEKGLDVRIDLPIEPAGGEKIGSQIISDRTRVRQILNNLVDNAIRYTDEGSVTVSLQRDQSGNCQLSVRDTGRGLARDEQPWIFEAFRRGSSSQLHDGGTGLGLAIASQLVEALGGNIEVESAVGHGTRFTVRLPPSAAATVALGAHDDAAAVKDANQYDDKLAGLRVLVAEDNAANRKYLVQILESAQVTVEEVENGVDLIARAFSREYDLILTDCRMSELGGLEAACKIRQREQQTDRHVPIIAVTAHTARRHSEPFLSAGVDDILIKPFTRAELFEKIASLVDRTDASSTE
jgi:CheY-like chemotaxis protein